MWAMIDKRCTRNSVWTGGVLGALALLSGCAAVGGNPAARAPDTFEFAAPSVSAAPSVRRGVQILVPEPVALKSLDSQNIVVRTQPLEIQYLDDAQWSDRLPKIVQRKLADAFQSSGRFGGVGLPGQGLAIDYQVVTELQAFSVDATRATANVSVAAKLLNDRNGVVVAARVFNASKPAGSTDGKGYVRALDAAFDEAASNMVVWVASNI